MKTKIDPADTTFSQYIRLRDMQCAKCHSRVELNDSGMPASHQNSHYWSRGNESTRFDEKNCDTLCFACHQQWGGKDRREYESFKRKQLGAEAYKILEVKAHTPTKKDRKLSLKHAKQLIKTLNYGERL